MLCFFSDKVLCSDLHTHLHRRTESGIHECLYVDYLALFYIDAESKIIHACRYARSFCMSFGGHAGGSVHPLHEYTCVESSRTVDVMAGNPLKNLYACGPEAEAFHGL